MKRIFNWTIGSFFRTLGRIICYLSIGLLIGLIASKMGFNLFIMPVNASGMPGWAGNLPNLTRAHTYDCNTSNSCTGLGGSIQGLTINDTVIRDMYVSSNVTVFKGGTAIQFSTPNLNPGYLYNVNVYACFNKSVLNGIYRIYSHEYSNPGISKSIELGVTRNGLDNTPGDGSQTFNNCQLFSGLIVPNQNASWTALRITADSSITGLQSVLIATETKELGVYTDTIRQIIEDSNGNVKEAVDKVAEETKKTNDSINNTDTTGASENANGFFNDFSDTDFGLSSIVTSPLRAINAMLNNTCVAPSATYKGQTFSLPCGNILWDRPGGDTFKTFLNVMYGGFLAYFVIRKFFLDVENLKNPNNDKVEVDKL